MNEIVTGLWVGSREDADQVPEDWLVICVLEGRDTVSGASWIPVLDQDHVAQPAKLDRVANMIDAALQAGQIVLVHCGAGIERSPLAVAWYLATKRRISLDAAYAHVIATHPVAQDRRSWLPELAMPPELRRLLHWSHH